MKNRNRYTRYVRCTMICIVVIALLGGTADAKPVTVDGKAWMNVSYDIHSIGNDRVSVKVVIENTGTITAKDVNISLSNYINVNGRLGRQTGFASVEKLQYGGNLIGSSLIVWRGELGPKEKHEIKYIVKKGHVKDGKFMVRLHYTYLRTAGSMFGHTINLFEGRGDATYRPYIP